MSRMKIFGLIALCALASTATSAKPPLDARLRQDPQLTKKVTLSGTKMQLPEVLTRISEVADVDILAQGDLLRRPVVIAVKDKTVAEVMENLAVLFGGTWVRRGDAYVLITDEVTARLVATLPLSATTDREEDALFRSLTASQRARLLRGERVEFQQLSPAQQRVASFILRNRFLKEPERFPTSILTGKGVALVPIKILSEPREGMPPAPTGSITIELGVPAIENDGMITEVYLASIQK